MGLVQDPRTLTGPPPVDTVFLSLKKKVDTSLHRQSASGRGGVKAAVGRSVASPVCAPTSGERRQSASATGPHAAVLHSRTPHELLDQSGFHLGFWLTGKVQVFLSPLARWWTLIALNFGLYILCARVMWRMACWYPVASYQNVYQGMCWLCFVSWCAAKYQNEAEVGDALAEAFESGLVKREDLFITTKVDQITKSMLLFSVLFWKRVSDTENYMSLKLVKIVATNKYIQSPEKHPGFWHWILLQSRYTSYIASVLSWNWKALKS